MGAKRARTTKISTMATPKITQSAYRRHEKNLHELPKDWAPMGLADRAAVQRLRAGGVIVHATEGVFGLAARAFDRVACRSISRLKLRSAKKPFIVVAASFAQVKWLITASSGEFQAENAGWPGPETWILTASTAAPKWLCGGDGGIALRVTAHPQMAYLCANAGPLISTSANPANRRPALNLLTARRYFAAEVDYYLPGRLQQPGRPSRIRDARSGLSLRE